ncbi:TonB-dependent receptor [Carboxylicivirga sp. M1479]|uniref:SusC/RagA family TonB-linked outer membrane protein n=1 Tax=Carboxylicivirga sp. M1479 TaxID=2594476 RepID=UPI0011776E7D|nr:TonB-dependent receptor [Carboxylicivirga sp. M1479]TRX72076.1 TonB-dependent receptor [Carboxylicivirga sp. M1479]
MKHVLGIFLFLLALTSQAQNLTVTGTVTDAADGLPLPGVSVVVKGTTTGTVTNVDGQFQLMSSQGDVLVFSFIGMVPQEVTVTSETINIALEEDATDLDEVVVVGYGVQKKALVTGANANVKGEALAELNTGSAMEALQGLAAGVNITRSNGAPGAGTRVTIRGAGTIENASPLYIVDGVAVGGGIDYLNPSDIESIDVLKDAASAAIYGSRAANGVILVTTRKGKKGQKATVSYDGYYGVQNVYKTLPVLNAQEYMYIMDEARSNERLAPFDWQDKIVNGNTYMGETFPGSLGTEYGQDVWDQLQNGWKGTNWIDEMTQENAPIESHSVNITGASEDVTYSAGFSYFDQTGMLGGDITDAGYKRITGRLNTEFVVLKRNSGNLLTVGENFTYTNIENRSVATGNIYWNDLHNALVTNPLMPVNWYNEDINHRTGGFAPTLEGISMGQHNPIATMYYRHNYNWGKGNNIVGNVYAILEPIDKLKIRSSFGVDAWFGNSRSWSPTYELATQYQNTVDGAQQDMYQGTRYTWTNTATYDFNIDSHRFTALVGTEMVEDVLNMNVGGSKRNTLFGDPKYAYIDNTKNPEQVSEIGTWGKDWAAQGGGLMSYMGRLSYNFNEKYMADFTMRADGSSNFAEDNRWGYFPSVSAGWNFTEESFMQDFDFLTYGKLRASWGQNGNQDIRNFVYSSNIAYKDQGYYFGPNKDVPQQAAVPANVPNPDVTWETSEQINIGFDTRWLDSRLGFTFDWYMKTTKDWLVDAPILGTFGAGAPFINGGDVENKGFELMLTWNDNVGDFKYGATVTGAYNKNTVTKLANAEGIIFGSGSVLSQGTSDIARVQIGNPIGFFYGYETNGIFQNQTDVDNYVNADGAPIVVETEADTPRQPGDVNFVDQNGDGVINDDDRVMLGSPLPDFELGIQLNAEYKGVFVNTTLAGKFGQQVMQSYRSFADQLDQNYTTQIFGRWHGEGTSNRLPRLTYNSNANTNLISDIYMHDADYLRINNLTVGYKFDRLIRDIEWMKAAKVYMSVNNLYTFTKYDGMDPEVGYGPDAWSSGVDLGLYPLPRTVMFGVNVTF